MAPASLLLIATSLALLAGSVRPRPGEAALVVAPGGASPIAAFATPGWRVLRITRQAGMTLLLAAPDGSGAEPSRLREAAQGWVVLRAAPGTGCTQDR